MTVMKTHIWGMLKLSSLQMYVAFYTLFDMDKWIWLPLYH